MTTIRRSLKKIYIQIPYISDIAGVLVMLFLAVVIFSILTPGFFTLSNLSIISQQGAMLAVVTLGMGLVLILEEIDLSIGSVMALAGIVTGIAMTSGLGVVAGVLIGLLAGLCAGATSGLLIAFTRLHSFVITLGMMGMARGLALVFTEGYTVTGFPPGFSLFFQSEVFRLPMALWIVFAVGTLIYFLQHHTRFGTSLYAIGSNVEVARLSAIPVLRNKAIVFMIMGILSGLAGIMIMARLNSATPGTGVGYEFDAIAAAVVGGVPLEGGRGKTVGALLGALLITILRNGMGILGVGLYWQLVVIGVTFIVAYMLQKLREA